MPPAWHGYRWAGSPIPLCSTFQAPSWLDGRHRRCRSLQRTSIGFKSRPWPDRSRTLFAELSWKPSFDILAVCLVPSSCWKMNCLNPSLNLKSVKSSVPCCINLSVSAWRVSQFQPVKNVPICPHIIIIPPPLGFTIGMLFSWCWAVFSKHDPWHWPRAAMCLLQRRGFRQATPFQTIQPSIQTWRGGY